MMACSQGRYVEKIQNVKKHLTIVFVPKNRYANGTTPSLVRLCVNYFLWALRVTICALH